MLGVALVSVWAITLAVLLCGDGAAETPAQRERRRARARRAVSSSQVSIRLSTDILATRPVFPANQFDLDQANCT
ncbi:hypothetical protein PAHAL_2G304500 [Panicum hallii]|uniref:Uncharacterized protein n=1 Tax=Panicum hallii TaxID=206008 RepID=A0A2T8KQY7_9POAL|nr:hypothetical protein PAHAL_2G304500 [Panicum hallii]